MLAGESSCQVGSEYVWQKYQKYKSVSFWQHLIFTTTSETFPYIILINIKELLPYQTQRAEEEDCGTFCGPPETVIVQKSNALNYLRPKIFNWETFVLIFLIMHSTHLR